MQFKLKIDFSDSTCNLLISVRERFIFFPELNFLIISYMIEEVVVVLPSSRISTLFNWCINIKSRSVAVIVSFELLASNKILESIGNVLLFSITPWQ